MVLTDSHCHFFSPRFFETLGREAGPQFSADPATGVPAALGWDPPQSPEALADRWIGELDRHDVARAVLIASVPGDEDSVADAVRRYPTRLIGYFMLNPVADDAPARVRRATGELGLKGLCLFPAMHRYSLLDPRVAAVLEAVPASSVVFVHCGVLSVGARKKLGLPSRFEIRYGQPLDVQALATTWPNVRFVIPHFGAGLFREALMAAATCSNIYLDTSSSNAWIALAPGLTLSHVFRQAVAVAGPERLLFGTDSSFFPRGWHRAVYESQLAAAREANLSNTEIELVFCRNLNNLVPY
jgi:predicted TIM-barrel fold metal-dependent hydrolase